MNIRIAYPELIAGIISSIFFFWLYPEVTSIHRIVCTMYPLIDIQNAPLILSAAMGMLIVGLYGIFGIYCILKVTEKLFQGLRNKPQEMIKE